MKRLISGLMAIAVCMSASADQIDRIIRSMTLEQKAMMLVGVWEADKPSNIISSAGRTHPLESQGIGMTIMNDGATGLRMDTLRKGYPDERYYCTGFPVSIMMASTWNDELVRKVGATLGDEMTAYGVDLILAPSLNLQRNPLCGRNFEYYSEDPYLAGHTAAMMVQGVQSKGTGATIKHFAANNQQTARVNNDAIVSQRALRELYLRNFEIAVKEGQPWAVMNSLNWINGTRASASKALLTDILRNEWGWNGVVMTDWMLPENTAACAHAGNDLFMGGAQSQVEDIIKAVNDGTLSIADVDRNVRNVLSYVMKTHSHVGVEPTFAPDLGADAEVALEAAQEGIVLLKNNAATLPLKEEDTVAVFGVGTYLFYANGLGAADVNKPYTINLIQGMKEARINTHPVVDEFYQKYFEAQDVQLRERNARTWKNWFFGYKVPEEAPLRDFFIQKRAQDCSKAIITIARNCGEALDRNFAKGEYLLTDTEKEMLESVCREFHARGKQVIVVVNTGAAIDVNPWSELADAVVLAWQPGQEGGRAVADVLSGKVCPSGKLPVTWALDYHDIPSSANFPVDYTFDWEDVKPYGRAGQPRTKNLDYTNYEEDIWIGYRYFSTFGKPVAYPFGYGLSYTTFEWSDAKVEKVSGEMAKVSILVTNTGSVSGKDVVELYSTAPVTEDFETPVRELRAYSKTPLLGPGESVKVSMDVALKDLASFHEDVMSWITAKGTHILSFASSADDVRATVEVTVPKAIIRKAPTEVK